MRKVSVQLRRLKVLKIIGIIGLITASGLAGIMKAYRLKRRIYLLEDYMKMIMDLKSRINYMKEPLPDIFRRVEKTDDSKAIYLLSDISSQISKKNLGIAGIWPQSVKQVYRDEPLSHDDLEIFKYPGRFLGQTDYENHLDSFAYLEEKLHMQMLQAAEEYRKKGPMYSKLGFFIGAAGAILLM